MQQNINILLNNKLNKINVIQYNNHRLEIVYDDIEYFSSKSHNDDFTCRILTYNLIFNYYCDNSKFFSHAAYLKIPSKYTDSHIVGFRHSASHYYNCNHLTNFYKKLLNDTTISTKNSFSYDSNDKKYHIPGEYCYKRKKNFFLYIYLDTESRLQFADEFRKLLTVMNQIELKYKIKKELIEYLLNKELKSLFNNKSLFNKSL